MRTAREVLQFLPHHLKALRIYLSLIKEPTREGALELEKALTRYLRVDDAAKFIRALRASPDTLKMITETFLANYALADLALYPEGTLGHGVYVHMTKNGLEPFSPVSPKDDLDYFRQRFLQTHDIHHVITGYPATMVGEIAIIGFYVAVFGKQFHQDQGASASYPIALLVANLLHAVIFQPELIHPFVEAFVDGWRRGRAILPFWSIKWEEMWARPIEEIRTELSLPPSTLDGVS